MAPRKPRKPQAVDALAGSISSWINKHNLQGDPYLNGLLEAIESKKDLHIWAELNPTEYDLRVLSCTHPQLFDGSEIYDEARLVANLRRRLAEAKQGKAAKQSTQTELPTMATAEAEPIDAEFTIDGAADAASDTPAADEAGGGTKRRGRPKKGEATATGSGSNGATTTAVTVATKDAGTVAVYERITDLMQFVDSFGVTLYKSGMFGLQNPEQGKVLALACAAKRMNPIDVLRQFDVVEGKLSMKASAMLGELRSRGGSYQVLRRDAEGAGLRITYCGQTRDFSFTWEDAQKEPFVKAKDGKGINGLKNNWATPRARTQMLWARVCSDGVRTMAPEIASGIYCGEEIADQEEVGTQPITVQATVTNVTVAPAEAAPAVPPQAAATATAAAATPVAAAVAEPAPSPNDKITAVQLQQCAYFKKGLAYGESIWKQVLDKFGVTTARDLTVAQGEKLLAWLNKKAKEAGLLSDEIPF